MTSNHNCGSGVVWVATARGADRKRFARLQLLLLSSFTEGNCPSAPACEA